MTSRAGQFLRTLAAGLLARLGFPLRAGAAVGPGLTPPAAPLIPAGTQYYPAVTLGLPGNWTPQTGCWP